jgi:hypothetical protein
LQPRLTRPKLLDNAAHRLRFAAVAELVDALA